MRGLTSQVKEKIYTIFLKSQGLEPCPEHGGYKGFVGSNPTPRIRLSSVRSRWLLVLCRLRRL